MVPEFVPSEDTGNEPGEDDWYKLISHKGSERIAGEFRELRVATWMLHFFRNVEMAVVFAQVLVLV